MSATKLLQKTLRSASKIKLRDGNGLCARPWIRCVAGGNRPDLIEAWENEIDGDQFHFFRFKTRGQELCTKIGLALNEFFDNDYLVQGDQRSQFTPDNGRYYHKKFGTSLGGSRNALPLIPYLSMKNVRRIRVTVRQFHS